MSIASKSAGAPTKKDLGSLLSRFVCRVGGVPTDVFQSMRGLRTSALLDRLHDIQRELQLHKETATDVLYDAVGDPSNSEHRGAFLQIKRDIYNLRPLDEENLTQVQQTWSDNTREAVEVYRNLMTKRRDIRTELRETYHDETCRARKVFREVVLDEDFQKGLLISSQSLFSAQAHYLKSDLAELRGREKSIERGLLRYLSRTAMKATPFGTFCAVLPGAFSESRDFEGQTSAPIKLEGDLQDKETQVRLNKSLFGILQRHLKDRPAIRQHLNVELNPTLRRRGEEFRFLANVDGQEVFQRLPRNPVLDIIVTLLAEGGREPLRDLGGALHQHSDIAASEEEADKYLDRLLGIGFLRFRLGISEQEVNWDRPLQRLLEPIDDDHARRTVDLLRTLRSKTEAYDYAPVKKRELLLEEMKEAINNVLEGMEVSLSVSRDLPFYEDATAQAEARVDQSELQEAENTLAEYLSLTLPLSWPWKERINMRHFYEENYDEASVPLLKFYEDYYRNHYKEHLERRQQSNQGQEVEDYNVENPFGLDSIEQIEDARSQLQEYILDQWADNPEAEFIDIDLQDLEEITRDLPSFSGVPHSVSFFAQPFSKDEEEGIGLIVPNGEYFAGYGKYFSRFLHLFGEEITEHLRDTNANLTDHYVAEICGSAHFNANLHPPLLPREISYPTAESGNADIQLRSSNLQVEPDPECKHEIRIRHQPSERRVFPVDLGFLNPQKRPPLYQFLARFSPVTGFRLPLPNSLQSSESEEAVSFAQPDDEQMGETPRTSGQKEKKQDGEVEEEGPTIVRRPRIQIDQQIVVTRQQWWVPSLLFPERREQETDMEYFVRVDRWRRKHDIPREVYVRLLPLPATGDEQDQEASPKKTETAEEELGVAPSHGDSAVNDDQANGDSQPEEEEEPQDRTRGSRDYRKPQYIDFQNPLLVNLFGKLTVNLDRYMAVVEERFPDANDLPEVEGQTFTNELILQMDVPLK